MLYNGLRLKNGKLHHEMLSEGSLPYIYIYIYMVGKLQIHKTIYIYIYFRQDTCPKIIVVIGVCETQCHNVRK